MLELRFAITEQQKSVLTGNRLIRLALGVWAIYSGLLYTMYLHWQYWLFFSCFRYYTYTGSIATFLKAFSLLVSKIVYVVHVTQPLALRLVFCSCSYSHEESITAD